MITASNWAPATPAERYSHIDILRGLALFGVLIVNLETGFRIPLLEQILGPHPESGWANQIVDLLVDRLLEFKAITIFSFLFGAGIAMQAERFASPAVSARTFLARRLGWLFLLGVSHMFLIWNGDILALYGVCGLLLLPSLSLRWPALLVLGAVAMALPNFVSIPLHIPTGEAAAVHIARAREVYGHGGFFAILMFRGQESWSLIVPLLISILPRTVGLMYWGMAAWRSGILRAPERHRRTLLAALALGVVGGAAYPSIPSLLALAYVSAFLLLLKPGRALSLPGLAATGRMALTNYLIQSIVLGIIFYGYGFGLFGRLGSAAAAVIGVTIYLTQVQLSRLWLAHFQFGPFEWLWRSLSYGRRPVSTWQLRNRVP